ncbi:uncharacterized protein LOC121732589 isoform X2 [Aricia agestis]|uniref:uncharacterized protein LOC121732589 isoform X2 n=1 Tax=Aricia agestis TaxID=91739 RepID=UPI001C20913C|nr:uncharacterized protein LOC121732589 isoform X2 [Aricia agestis]
MTVLLVFGLFIVIVTAHNITFLDVPQYGDPRRDVELTCHYVSEPGDPALHSVKWYRDTNEIFRYTPGQQTRTFNTSAGGATRGSCNLQSCAITVTLPRRYNALVSFTCEVSTEGPRFAVVNQTKFLTVAVTMKEDPLVTGLAGSVQLNEDILLNCSTAPAMPPPTLMWYIDGIPEKTEPWMNDNTEMSPADEFGLRASWRPIRFRVTTAKGVITARCEATQPTRPPYSRATNATIMIARSPHLSMFTASDSGGRRAGVLLVVCMSVHIFSKYSALRSV